ncbi:MAG: spermidine/putrescine ABC transporter substrate-binding protein [Anaerolineales bacterium]|nr:spermidine/putrescine ABC transporter substrate-binding protein [Anaerolineales bacterium]
MIKRITILVMLLSGILSACAPAAPPVTSTELNIYTFSEYIPDELIAGFEKETGVQVTVESYATNEEMLDGLRNKPGKYDLIIPSDYAVEELIAQDALFPLDLSTIPNYDKIDTAFLNPYFDPRGVSRRPGVKNEKFSLPYLWGTTGIMYDPTKLLAPITSWQDLWRPELAGHIVVLDDSREMMGIALLTLGYNKNETNPSRLAEARDKLKELAPGIVAFDAETTEEYLLSGQAWVAVVYNGNAALAERQNPNLVYVLPSEGAGIWFDNMAIPADAPHSDAAIAFMNYVLEPEHAALIVEAYPYSTPNLGALEYLQANNAEVYDAYVASLASNPPQDALLGATLVKRVNPTAASLYEEYWSEVKSAK